MNARRVIRSLLLGFVLVSIGFACGRQTAPRPEAASPSPVDGALTAVAPAADAPVADAAEEKLIVYYLHKTVRCVTCNSIEAMTQEVLQTQFSDELRAGRVEWRTANMDENPDLARRFDVASSSVVLVSLHGGQERSHETLTDVWTLARQPARFADYVAGAVASRLPAREDAW